MSKVSRRIFLCGVSAIGLTGKWPSFAQAKPKIVVVGGGFGGSSFAKQMSTLLPSAEITLIDSSPTYFACPLSNLVIANERSLSQQKFVRSYLSRSKVKHVRSVAQKIDGQKKKVILVDDAQLPYDVLVVSPGVDFKFGVLEGYDRTSTQIMPHGWKAGEQTELLGKSLANMENGGVIVISVPRAPFRCPPGPYERASLMAHYLQRNKPKSKILILDSNEQFSKQAQFTAEWSKNYKNIIEWRSSSNDGTLIRVDRKSKTLYTDFEVFRPAIANVIPPQQAGVIAQRSGLTDSTGWCPINSVTFESKLQKDVYILGDATIASPMPKSAYSANMQAKVCAIQLARKMSGVDEQATILTNTCYSFISPETAISIVGVYSNESKFRSIRNSGGASPVVAQKHEREAEARQAKSWFSTITQEAFA